MDDMHDQVAGEIDRRKLEKLVEDGIVTQEELDNAQIIDLTDEDEHE